MMCVAFPVCLMCSDNTSPSPLLLPPLLKTDSAHPGQLLLLPLFSLKGTEFSWGHITEDNGSLLRGGIRCLSVLWNQMIPYCQVIGLPI